jgi:kojibiose phosphorylase
LHGEGYKGHVFWDTELFMLPFFTYSLPNYARALLSYRWHKLEGAKKNAALGGYKGARFPWESADSGLEETPQWGFDYKQNKVRIWTGDIEIHITCDIAYGLREYIRATGDADFLRERAAPIIFETARFWASRLEYDEKIGPDEFHEHVNNNAYTNALVRWNLRYAAELAAKHGVSPEEAAGWTAMAEKILVPRSGGLIEQYDGFFDKIDVSITEFDANQMPLWPDGVDITKLSNYRLVKQADVIMLTHLLREEFTPEEMKENYIYYENRTMHKSSLSPSMYALMGTRTNQHGKAYTNFMRTVLTDIADNQGNTAHGIHAAAAGGAWCAMFYGFCGVRVDAGGSLTVNPWLPEKWNNITMNFYFKGERMRLTCTRGGAKLEKI